MGLLRLVSGVVAAQVLRETRGSPVLLAAAKAEVQLGKCDQALRLVSRIYHLFHFACQSAPLAKPTNGPFCPCAFVSQTLQLIKSNSGNAEAYAVRGLALFLSVDYDQALKNLKEALRLDPDDQMARATFKRCKHVQRTATSAKAGVPRNPKSKY